MNDQTKDSIEKIAEEMQYELLSWVGGVGASTVARWMNQLRALPPSATAQEAAATFVQSPYGNYPELKWRAGFVAKIGDRIYTAPPPQPVSETAAQGSVEFGEALDELLAASFDQNWEEEKKARAEVMRLYALAAAPRSAETGR